MVDKRPFHPEDDKPTSAEGMPAVSTSDSSGSSPALPSSPDSLTFVEIKLPSDAMTVAEPVARVSKSPSGPQTSAMQFTLFPGMILAQRYQILQVLGEGGMGTVYKAEDRELDRLVALKVIRPELAQNPDILQRFKQEILLASRVTDRNIIRIYDLGDADGLKFITMEYVDGEDLRSLLQSQGKLPVQEAINIIEQVFRGLQSAHREGIIHRDLKPGNIMRDKQDRVVVMDFGLARVAGEEGMTRTGFMIGTMEYMSPEQAHAKGLDARSDIYTTGLILYELLTGKMPYEAESAIASLMKRTQQRAVPAADLDPSIPKELSNIVSRCLEPDPKNRYQNTQQVLSDLAAWQGGHAAAALRFDSAERPWAQTRPWPLIVALFAFLILCTVGFLFRDKLISTATRHKPAGRVASLAILPFRNASGDPSLDWLGSSMSEMLSTDVGQSASLRTVSSDRLHQVLKDLRIDPNSQLDPQTLRQLGEFSNAQTLVWGQYVKVGDQIRIDAIMRDLKEQRSTTLKADAPSEKDLLAAVDLLAQSIRESLALSPEIVRELQAQAFRPSSKSMDALREYNQGLELVRQGNNLDAQKRFDAATQADSQFALAFSRLAQTYSTLGYDNEAERYSRRAVELSQQLPPPEKYLIEANDARIQNDTQKAVSSYENLVKVSPEDPDIQFTLASIYESADDYEQAMKHYSKVLEQDPKYVDALLACGRVRIKSGDPESGLDFLNRALTLAIQLDNQEEKAAILQAIGVAYRLTDKPQEALKNYQESMAIKRQIGDKRGIAVSLNESAQAQVMLGRNAEALASYKEALQIRREIGDKRGIGDTLNDLANFYQERAQVDDALKLYKEALQINRDLGDDSGQALILNNIGTAYLSRGQYDDALTYYQQSLQLREKLKVPDDIAETVRNLAATNTKLGQYEAALSQYLKALDLWRSTGDKRGSAVTSYDMGSVFAYQGRYGAALNSRQDALKLFRDLKERSTWMVEALNGYGESLAQAGRGEEAQQHLDEALSLARELKNDNMISMTLRSQGDLLSYRGDFKAARGLYDQALQSANKAKDSENILLARVALARNDIHQGRPAAALSVLRIQGQQAESQGLKYEAVQCSLDLSEALINTKALPQARVELERALTRAQKAGMKSLQARAEYLLATDSRLGGNNIVALDHYHEFMQLLDEISKESGNDKIRQRNDFAVMLADTKRWTSP